MTIQKYTWANYTGRFMDLTCKADNSLWACRLASWQRSERNRPWRSLGSEFYRHPLKLRTASEPTNQPTSLRPKPCYDLNLLKDFATQIHCNAWRNSIVAHNGNGPGENLLWEALNETSRGQHWFTVSKLQMTINHKMFIIPRNST